MIIGLYSAFLMMLSICSNLYCAQKVSPKEESSVVIREAHKNDFNQLKKLYQAVATQKGGIAREFDEITDDYIKKNLDNALANGKIVVAEVNGQLVGSLHGYKPEPKVFHHVLSDLTIAVHPDFQGKSIGKQLFSSFLTSVKNTLSSIARVELFVR